MQYKIEKLNESHIKGIMEIDKFSSLVPWSEDSFTKELDNPVAFYFVALKDDQVIGYAGMWWSFDTCEITNIAVHPEYRRQGIGNTLLLELINLCKEYEVSYLNLDVRVTNDTAKNLYIKNGFKQVGLRKKYYSNGEDALLMTKEIF